MKNLLRLTLTITFSIHILSCSSTTKEGEVGADRKQLLLIPNSKIVQMSEKSYEQVKADAAKAGKLDQNPAMVARVNQVAQRLIPPTRTFRKDAVNWNWEVHVITQKELNAYCMPGGKIMFYTEIIEKLNLTDAEIAAIMGHEIAHALREHGRERMSQALIPQIGLQFLLASGQVDEKYLNLTALGLQYVFFLPNGRSQESEADDLGLELMARAGYNPAEAVTLWKKMSAQSGTKTPEFLSTHPSDATRIKNIESLLPKVMPLYNGTKK